MRQCETWYLSTYQKQDEENRRDPEREVDVHITLAFFLLVQPVHPAGGQVINSSDDEKFARGNHFGHDLALA